MKKIFLTFAITMCMIAPVFAAPADPVDDDPPFATLPTKPTVSTAATSDTVDGVAASAGYVKGAYNAAVGAINNVADFAEDAARYHAQEAELRVTGYVDDKKNAIENKLGGGANGYNINAKSLQIQGKDVLTVDNTKTLTNKTIDADENTISDLTTSNLKSGVLVDSTTGIAAESSASDSKLVSEKAVAAALAGATTGQVTLNGTQTLTNKTIDADVNTIQDLTTTNFKTGTVVTTVGAEGVDTALPTEKAVHTAITTATSDLATKTGVAATAKAAVNGATVTYSLAGLGVSTGAVGGTATVPIMAQWGDTSPTTSVQVDLTGTSTVTGLTGNTSGLTATIAADNNVTYTAGN